VHARSAIGRGPRPTVRPVARVTKPWGSVRDSLLLRVDIIQASANSATSSPTTARLPELNGQRFTSESGEGGQKKHFTQIRRIASSRTMRAPVVVRHHASGS
jgi:hypothetical protein